VLCWIWIRFLTLQLKLFNFFLITFRWFLRLIFRMNVLTRSNKIFASIKYKSQKIILFKRNVAQSKCRNMFLNFVFRPQKHKNTFPTIVKPVALAPRHKSNKKIASISHWSILKVCKCRFGRSLDTNWFRKLEACLQNKVEIFVKLSGHYKGKFFIKMANK
jgi:hypothetical protein